ncbi:MAG: hypothetical protein SAJ12_08005 [Jaaginema sp. PMC 1079.18]|nr:hypothetical protein [Jaaginema sp. PMC 1080.18]MEC4850941.1 hypothetical protein [Jaaginema sp. PMC 1079.18]MEC4867061.1 hypothetical protein [Jaaginema sp. PMC 1078.18]
MSQDRVEYIELFWRCPECGKEDISAIPHLNPTGWYCPSCFFRRDNSVQLYETENSRVIDDPELIARIEKGQVDWECKHCGALNPDTGVTADLLVCDVCQMWQIDPIDPSAPQKVTSGGVIPQQSQIANASTLSTETLSNSFSSQKSSLRRRRSFRKLAIVGGLLGSVASGGWWFFSDHPIEVTVQSLAWEVTVDVQQLRPVERSGWDETVPANATILSSENRQRGTREVQRGTRTVMVDEQYQSGTQTETYTEQEQYQSGTEEVCTTTSTGTGAGKRTCRNEPVYETRSVEKRREVPVYSTRQVNKQVPNMVTEPVYDTYIFYRANEWQHAQTFTSTGFDDEPRLAPNPQLDNLPYPEQALSPVTTCQITGMYQRQNEQKIETWGIPCEQFDRIDTGEIVELEIAWNGQATLHQILSD